MTLGQKHRHKQAVSYPISFGQRVYSMLVMPTVVLLVMILILWIFGSSPKAEFSQAISLNTLFLAVSQTLIRLFIAFAMALVVAIPLAVLATLNQHTERFF